MAGSLIAQQVTDRHGSSSSSGRVALLEKHADARHGCGALPPLFPHCKSTGIEPSGLQDLEPIPLRLVITLAAVSYGQILPSGGIITIFPNGGGESGHSLKSASADRLYSARNMNMTMIGDGTQVPNNRTPCSAERFVSQGAVYLRSFVLAG